jgi:predicted cobalt transporter CbtA
MCVRVELMLLAGIANLHELVDISALSSAPLTIAATDAVPRRKRGKKAHDHAAAAAASNDAASAAVADAHAHDADVCDEDGYAPHSASNTVHTRVTIECGVFNATPVSVFASPLLVHVIDDCLLTLVARTVPLDAVVDSLQVRVVCTDVLCC